MEELMLDLNSNFNEDKLRKDSYDSLIREWTIIDRKNFIKSPFCSRCLYWDVKNYKEKSRENYLTMILIKKEDEWEKVLTASGKFRRKISGCSYFWKCKTCSANKAITLDYEETENKDERI